MKVLYKNIVDVGKEEYKWDEVSVAFIGYRMENCGKDVPMKIFYIHTKLTFNSMTLASWI